MLNLQKGEKRERDHKLPISEMKQGITTDYKHQKVKEKYYKQACIQHVTALMIQISKSRKMQKTPNGKSGTHGKFIKSLTKNWCPFKTISSKIKNRRNIIYNYSSLIYTWKYTTKHYKRNSAISLSVHNYK